jgi:hypothetical protein
MRSPGCEPTHSASPIPTRPLSLLVGGPSLKGLPARRGIVNNPTTADKPTAPAGGDWSRLSSGWGLGGAGSAESTRIGPNRSVSEEQRGVPLGEHPLLGLFAVWSAAERAGRKATAPPERSMIARRRWFAAEPSNPPAPLCPQRVCRGSTAEADLRSHTEKSGDHCKQERRRVIRGRLPRWRISPATWGGGEGDDLPEPQSFLMRPFPPHFLHGAGYILRPGLAGCFTG